MRDDGSDARWQQIVDLHDEIDAVEVPATVSRIDGKPRQASPKAIRFAEALAFSDQWSRISEARQHRGDLAA